MRRIRFLFLFFCVLISACASNPTNKERAPSAESDFRKAECSVYRNNMKIIEAKNIKVTNANGGLRQGCRYTAADRRTTLFPIVVDGQGGLMIALEYDKKQILLSHDRTGAENSFGQKYWAWSVDSVIPHSGADLRVTCNMYLSDRDSILEDIGCPPDSNSN